ncbi:MAG TPA: ATP-binding protein [Anaerolineae bacterium]|nr:ATP-binding protein [Anaerolineae bacterium]
MSQLRRAYQQIIQAQENERRQLAERLHDETLQHLADLSVRMGLLRNQSQIKPADLDDLQKRLARTDRCLREIIRGMHPAVLVDLGLIEAVIAFLEALPLTQPTVPLRIELGVIGFNEQRLPDQQLELALYRFTQNAIMNALTHGKPSYIRVGIKWGLDAVEVRVEDNGCGLATTIEEAVRAGHFGLLTMRERIGALGGRFTASSAPGQGTQVSGRIPLSMPSPAWGQVDHYTFELA